MSEAMKRRLITLVQSTAKVSAVGRENAVRKWALVPARATMQFWLAWELGVLYPRRRDDGIKCLNELRLTD
jgi:hypothetical protein